jgi:hypothetical protein
MSQLIATPIAAGSNAYHVQVNRRGGGVSSGHVACAGRKATSSSACCLLTRRSIAWRNNCGRAWKVGPHGICTQPSLELSPTSTSTLPSPSSSAPRAHQPGYTSPCPSLISKAAHVVALVPTVSAVVDKAHLVGYCNPAIFVCTLCFGVLFIILCSMPQWVSHYMLASTVLNLSEQKLFNLLSCPPLQKLTSWRYKRDQYLPG